MSFVFALIVGAGLWIVGAVRFVLWLLLRSWHVPRDEFAHTLELDSSILTFLPGPGRTWYMGVQGRRRQRAHRREWAIRA